MYTLTEIATGKENVSFHQKLGERFSIIEREVSQQEFEKGYNALYSNNEIIIDERDINQNIYCLVVSEGGKSIHALKKQNFYYIVTENGTTFKNLTFK
ncbi:hypothetical protein [Flavobacterium sp.]|uniref:hypothetical protein n=1 Tax=Flavobacterium sp. TaxID=239 RepID=UPI0037525E36